MKKEQKLLIIPDTHVPFHHKQNFKTMIAAAKKFKPDIIVILGDFADAYAVSSHTKSPSKTVRFNEEVYQVNCALDLVDSIGARRKEYIMGNHENRLERYVADRAPEMDGLVSWNEMLHLRDRKWNVTEYGQEVEIGEVYFTHDCGHAGKYAHYQSYDAVQHNVVIGHTHRMGYTVIGNSRGKPHVSAMFGWLGDPDEIKYEHRIKVRRNSVQGFGVGHMLPTGEVFLQPVPFVNGCVMIDGVLTRPSEGDK